MPIEHIILKMDSVLVKTIGENHYYLYNQRENK